LLLVLPATFSFGQADLGWTIETPFPENNYGPEANVVFESGTRRIMAGSRIDAGDVYVYFIRYFGTDAWEGSWRAFAWSRDTGPDYGVDLSMASFGGPSLGKYGFAYGNESDGSLEYMEYTYDGEHSFFSVILDNALQVNGHANSLAFDTSGMQHIATRTQWLVTDDHLVHVRRVTSGGNCGVGDAAGLWQCDTVDIGEGIASFTSLAFSSSGYPMIAYTSASNTLMLATHAPLGLGNCGYGDAAGWWNCTSLVSSTKNASDKATEIGGHVALAVDPSAPSLEEHIAFLTTDTATGEQTLRYARWVGSGGSCTDTRWDCMAITAVGTGAVDLDLALDGEDIPLIVYTDSTDNQVCLAKDLRTPLAGNCGPGLSWRCSGITGSYPSVVKMGSYVDIATDEGGQPAVAYSSLNLLDSTWNLHIAHPWIHRDFFETGDLSWWSSVVGESP